MTGVEGDSVSDRRGLGWFSQGEAGEGEQGASGFALTPFEQFRPRAEPVAPQVTGRVGILAGRRGRAGANLFPIAATAAEALAADGANGGPEGLRGRSLAVHVQGALRIRTFGHQHVRTAHAGHAEFPYGFGCAELFYDVRAHFQPALLRLPRKLASHEGVLSTAALADCLQVFGRQVYAVRPAVSVKPPVSCPGAKGKTAKCCRA
jgi:hypothetical protein